MSAIDLKTAEFPLRMEKGDTFVTTIDLSHGYTNMQSKELAFSVNYGHCLQTIEMVRSWAAATFWRDYDGFTLLGSDLTPESVQALRDEIYNEGAERRRTEQAAARLARPKPYRFVADIEFGAEDLDDAWMQLARHFMKLAEASYLEDEGGEPPLDFRGEFKIFGADEDSAPESEGRIVSEPIVGQ